MKKIHLRGVAVLLCLVLAFSTFTAGAVDVSYGPYDYDAFTIEDQLSEPIKSASMSDFEKSFYNFLNKIGMGLLRIVSALYPNPSDWESLDSYNGENFLPGRETYATEAAEGNQWYAGYASRSIVPDDFEPGKYYIGRDLTNRLAQGVNDDNRVRVVALDDNSGEGLVIFAVVDSLGVTSADTRAIRAEVVQWAQTQGIRIAALNLSVTHSHSALDTQGVATESIYRILTASFKNLLDIGENDPRLANANAFKQSYLATTVEAVKEAVLDLRPGDLYYAQVDGSDYIKDKRGLIAPEDIPPIASLKFVPADGSEGIYMADISCHPTSFSASHGLLSSDYIYYMEQRIQEKTGYNFLFIQGASGQLSRMGLNVDEEQLPEEERLGATTRYSGRVFADLILAADDGSMEKLEPVLNAKYAEYTFTPENDILVLAVKAGLVNNAVYTTDDPMKPVILMEEGYVELGGRVGFGIVPVELYPEVFYGSEIIGDLSWDGTAWEYDAMTAMAPEGVDLYAMPLSNDSLGYCVLDNNYAFFGHIIGDEIADEVLSLGEHTASTVVTHFAELMEQCK